MFSRRFPLSILVFSLVVMLIMGCVSEKATPADPEQPQPEVPQSVDYTVGLGHLPATLDPMYEVSMPSLGLYNLLYDTLIRMETEGKPLPALAKSWKMVSPTVWEFALREDVTFHNGEPFTAESVRFSIMDCMVDPDANSPWLIRFERVERIEIVDDHTVRFVTYEPSAGLLNALTVARMLPPDYYTEKGPEGFAHEPVGTGPMKFVEWEPANYLKLEANPDYWAGKPDVDNLHFRVMPEDASRLAAIQTGEVDIVYNVPPEHAQPLMDRGLTIINRPIGQSMALGLRTTVPGPLQDKRIRKAFDYAIDKPTIVETVFYGQTDYLEGQEVGRHSLYFNPDVKAVYDPEKAKELLAEAGYNGEPIALEGSMARYPKDKESMEAVAQMLKDVGFNIELNILESSVWLDGWVQGTIGPAFIRGSLIAPYNDLNETCQCLYSTSPRKIHADLEFDALFDRAEVETDAQKRWQILQELSAHINEEVLSVYLWEVPGLYAANDNAKNVDFLPDTGMVLPGLNYPKQ